MSGLAMNEPMKGLPKWVPDSAKLYLAHTEGGQGIRALARRQGCHASTILRQVRKIETRRDDPLVDAALRHLWSRNGGTIGDYKGLRNMNADEFSAYPMDDQNLLQESRRALRRLSEPGAVLAVAVDMEKAVVVRETPDGGTVRSAVVDSHVAQAMALQDWIECDDPGRISRYKITGTGRAALSQMTAQHESKLRDYRDNSLEFQNSDQASIALLQEETDPRYRRLRNAFTESPLAILGRRRGKDGQPFLEAGMLAAGERLREDYELSQIQAQELAAWEQSLWSEETPDWPDTLSPAVRAARYRLTEALQDLGPGLGDIALRCCCYLEGLEAIEKAMGWSARSGKIVLRIALQRLQKHQKQVSDKKGDLIG